MPAASASLLFHPKKKNGVVQTGSPPKRPARPLPLRAQPSVEEDAVAPLPTGDFMEYKLISSQLNGWKYDVMKLDSRRTVDVTEWSRPVRLNRKEPRRGDAANGPSVPVAVGPMLGPDGKPVVGADGRVVMVDAEGRPIHASSGTRDGGGGGSQRGRGGRKFQKKTRQVFLVPEATRQLRREERFPWVLEDSSGGEVWLGAMEEVSKSETHAMFMPSSTDEFKFVPAHRWYKFQKKPHYRIPNLEEAESLMAQIQKNKDPERWLLHRKGQAASASTSAILKAEAEGRSVASEGSLVHDVGQSRGPGGRKLRAVDSGDNDLFGGEDEDGVDVKRKRGRELGTEGDVDEMDFEEDFADDDEKIEADDKEDEDAKLLEERLKKEYKAANKTREGFIDESDDEDDEGQLTKDGKAMKKMLKKVDKNGAYDSDEEKNNPYASSEEEEEEEPPVAQDAPAIVSQDFQTPQPPKEGDGTSANGQSSTPAPASRPGSPVPTPGLGGHLVVAKRATSPKVPRPKNGAGGGSRATSPLAGSGPLSRATSPDSRAGSPVAQSPPAGAKSATNKRKADEPSGPASPVGAPPPKPKKRKAVAPTGELEDRMLIEWLRETPNATTRECIHQFTPYLTDETKKAKFTALVREVAQLKNGVLVLRNAYRGGSAAPSPGATPDVK